MEIDKLRSRPLLGDLTEIDTVVKLEEGHRYATRTGDWRGFANEIKRLGPAAARQLWEFLDGLPQRAGASSHLHFATGMDDPEMTPAGSTATAAAIKWSDILSEAIDLVGYDFASTARDPLAKGQETFDRMDSLLSEADRVIASRLIFFKGAINVPSRRKDRAPSSEREKGIAPSRRGSASA
jgi:hypothetical protein